jgi:putative oxidoreductase
MKKLLTLGLIPSSSDFGLLVLRLWFGLLLLVNHGWPKLLTFSEKASTFSDPLGIGHVPSMIGALSGEVICSTLIVLGLATRLAALGAGFTMTVAFVAVHGMKLKGTGNGELAFVYLGVCVMLLIAGAGKFSLDRKLGAT